MITPRSVRTRLTRATAAFATVVTVAATATLAGPAVAPAAAAPAPASAAAGPLLTAATAAAPAPRWRYRGRAIDTCTAPALTTMAELRRTTPYRAIGIYIGGANRACAQPELTAAWARSIQAQGWYALPLYVGRQAPCTAFAYRIGGSTAGAEGIAAADDAIRGMQALGYGTRNPVFLDIEAYDRTNRACSARVRTFVDAFDWRVRSRGYLAGAYGSSRSFMADLVAWRADRTFRSPDVVWFANWDGRPTADVDPVIPRTAWLGARIHQYVGNTTLQVAGRPLLVDLDQVDAPVAVI